MHRLILVFALALLLRLATAASAELIINAPRPITHRVSVQVIQTALENGSSPSPMFGAPAREAAIKTVIDTIWSQAGIDVEFLPNIVRYNNTFAYQGIGVGVRPLADLGLMMTNAGLQGGILHPDPSVINMFFVNVVPGFDLKNGYWANGVGNIGHNGIAMYIGANVSAEHAGHWVSHEIAHNLGLRHAPAGSQNLMTTSRNTERVSAEQIDTIFQTQPRDDEFAVIPEGGTGFPILLPNMPGDYDRNGEVNASDYIAWRNTAGSNFSNAADGNGDGRVDTADYMVWKTNFAAEAGTAASSSANFLIDAGIPEPASLSLLCAGLSVAALSRSRRSRMA